MKTKRIFVAIKIDNTNEINKVFREVGFDLIKERIKWVDKKGLHLTLLFIGETDVEEIEAITDKLRIIVSEFRAFHLNLKSLGAFPSLEQATILWIGIQAEAGLFELQKEIHAQLLKNKPADDYNYTPHVTIGRSKGGVKYFVKGKKSLLNLKDWEDRDLLIEKLVLMESTRTKQGAIYRVLEYLPLKK
ncbi:2'-5' RNA ligase [Labilibaculum filiforme]|uniref:RNA 2',3'-cyclic phosphodiesterase n=1 Tax=Labilibaculum filiforme TaxID=1940526 RepID=A0A2N3HQN9_9BACT|nr:RNA 2',3'-cyclic phosphodiesterase [Labilibaculum filiforme]PKQ60375.1 2'-5' RNA ligase [Labilibaculum filiforme]